MKTITMTPEEFEAALAKARLDGVQHIIIALETVHASLCSEDLYTPHFRDGYAAAIRDALRLGHDDLSKGALTHVDDKEESHGR